MNLREDEWLEYYDAFKPHFTKTKIRDKCQPWIRTQNNARGSIVLIHGLSDSPYYMVDIANHFYGHLGYNVFLPLLHFHGLKKPGGLEGVEMEEWKRNVGFAVNHASALTPKKVSIGGLSTGGALSFYTACTSPKITGDLFLFSAALDLIIKSVGPLGDIVERILRSPWLSDFLDKRDSQKPLVADNPVKYAYVDKDGARELCRLIKEVDVLVDGFDKRNPFPKRVFAAHSYADDTANINGIKNLENRTAKKNFKSFYIDKDVGVTHGGLVLANDVIGASRKVCSHKNVKFDLMIKALDRFVEGG